MAWKVHLEQVRYTDSINVWVGETCQGQTRTILEPVKRVQLKPEEVGALHEPFMSFPEYETRQLLQALVDECWKFGITPSGYDEFRKENAARQAHLEDMRSIVSTKLKVPFGDTPKQPEGV